MVEVKPDVLTDPDGDLVPLLYRHNPDASGVATAISSEVLVLAELLFAPERVRSCLCSAEDMYFPGHRAMFNELASEADEPGGVDGKRLIQRLLRQRERPPLEIPWDEYLYALMAVGCTLTDERIRWVRKQGRIVHDRARIRRGIDGLERSLGRLAQGAVDDQDADDVFADAQSMLQQIAADARETVSSIQEAGLQMLESVKAGEPAKALPTGLMDLDDITNGFRHGELWVLAGLQGSGKTTLALQMASNAAFDRARSVLVSSLEMGSVELAERVFAARADVPSSVIRRRTIQPREIAAMESVLFALNGHLTIDERGGATVDQIAATAHNVRNDHGIDLLVVDHLQLIRHADSKANEYQTITFAVHALKALAKELRCSVLLLCQLNREIGRAENSTPQLKHLKGSSAIEQDADVVLLVQTETDTMGTPTNMRVTIGKNRSGPRGIVELVPQFEHFRVRDRYNGTGPRAEVIA